MKIGNTKKDHNKCLNWLKINNITQSLAAWLKQLLFCNLNGQVHNNNEKVMLNHLYGWLSFMLTHLQSIMYFIFLPQVRVYFTYIIYIHLQIQAKKLLSEDVLNYNYN